MKFISGKAALLTVFLSMLIFTYAELTHASGNISDANIFVYPKPFKIADLVLRNPSGQRVSLSDYQGKVVLLHFWSIQCPACRMEEPDLHHLKKTFGHQGLEVLGVNLVDSPQAIAGYAVANQMPFPVLFDGGQGFKLQVVNMAGKNTAFVVNPVREAVLEVPGFPTTYILDCRGSAVGYSFGAARWNDGAALSLIRGLVSEVKTCRPRISMNVPGTSSSW
jgi:thiol-disulfide isomerase/thioredoxin